MPTKYLTFGLELEASRIVRDWEEIAQRHNFRRHADRSIRHDPPPGGLSEVSSGERAIWQSVGARGWPTDQWREGPGGELITKRMLATVNDDGEALEVETEQEIYDAVEALTGCAEKVNDSCGFHVHLGRPRNNNSSSEAMEGASQWSDEQIQAFFTIGVLLENRLFNLCPKSRRRSEHCLPLNRRYTQGDILGESIVGHTTSDKYGNPKRYSWLNLIETKRSNGHGTVEIRMLGNTKRIGYVWAWVKLWLKIGALVAYRPAAKAINMATLTNFLEFDLEFVRKAQTAASNRLPQVDEDKLPEHDAHLRSLIPPVAQ